MRRLGAGGPAAKLIFELLVAVLQLLDRAGQLTDLRLQALDTQDLFGGRPLGFFLAGGLLLFPEHAADRRQRVLLGGGGAVAATQSAAAKAAAVNPRVIERIMMEVSVCPQWLSIIAVDPDQNVTWT